MNTNPVRQLSFCVLGMVLLAPAAPAQDAIEEIIVTARQREETLRDVPGTVRVLTSEDIERSGIQRAEDFIYMTPGVSIVDTAEVGDTQVNIRGINGARDAENSYALIVDGVLMTNPAALNREYANLRQIEVLKGPQGALYGRNAAAGAIIISTEKPGSEQGGYLKVSGAGDSTWLYSGAIEGALAENMNYRLQGDYRSTKGFYENTYLNQDDIVDDYRGYNVNARLTWDPSEATSWDFKFRYGEVDAALDHLQRRLSPAAVRAAFRRAAVFRGRQRPRVRVPEQYRSRQRAGSHGVLGPRGPRARLGGHARLVPVQQDRQQPERRRHQRRLRFLQRQPALPGLGNRGVQRRGTAARSHLPGPRPEFPRVPAGPLHAHRL